MSLKLDKRIKSIDDIQTILHYDVNCIRCKGYFFDEFIQTKDLSKCRYGELIDITTHDDRSDLCFKAEYEEGLVGFYRFFLPEADLKSVEKKYRRFTLQEFLTSFPMLTDITIREKGNIDCVVVCTVTAYRMRITSNDICLGVEWFSLKELFDKYEFKDVLGNWQPFGVINEDKE